MLVLSRRIGEKLFLGDDIEVMLLEVNGSQARIGIKAPREINVIRSELADSGGQHQDTDSKAPIKHRVSGGGIYRRRSKLHE